VAESHNGSSGKYQGSLTWETSLEEIAQFFADNGIEVGNLKFSTRHQQVKQNRTTIV